MKEFMVLVAVIVICSTNLFAGQCDILVDKLVEKGQLTELEGKDIKTANELLVQAEKNKTDEAIKKSSPVYKISGYSQFSYTSDPTLGGKEPFAIKTARVGFSWKLNEWTEFKIQPEFSSSAISLSTVTFKELWADFVADKNLLKVKIGQYIIPFSFENNYPASKSKVFDTPQSMSKVITSKYDYGVQLYGNLPGESLKNLLSWRIAVINGTTYASETDGMKDFSAYLITKPMNDLEFSVSDYNRYIATGSKYETHYGVSGKYETDMVFFTLEYIAGKNSTGVSDVMDAIITLEGKPFGLLSSDLSLIAPVVRLERWDENIWDGKYLSYYTVGVNIYADKSVRFLVDYLVKDDNILNNNKFNAMVQINY